MRDSLRLVIVLTLVATLSGGILAYTWDDAPIIEANNAAALADSILEVMPGAVSYEIWTVEASSSNPDSRCWCFGHRHIIHHASPVHSTF